MRKKLERNSIHGREKKEQERKRKQKEEGQESRQGPIRHSAPSPLNRHGHRCWGGLFPLKDGDVQYCVPAAIQLMMWEE